MTVLSHQLSANQIVIIHLGTDKQKISVIYYNCFLVQYLYLYMSVEVTLIYKLLCGHKAFYSYLSHNTIFTSSTDSEC